MYTEKQKSAVSNIFIAHEGKKRGGGEKNKINIITLTGRTEGPLAQYIQREKLGSKKIKIGPSRRQEKMEICCLNFNTIYI